MEIRIEGLELENQNKRLKAVCEHENSETKPIILFVFCDNHLFK